MGSTASCIPDEVMEDYLVWTYLNTSEIESLYKKFAQYTSTANILDERVHVKFIIDMVPQIKYNIFCDRILRVFSSKRDGCFSFEDLLDFFSVMSERCPTNVKARWAYRLFDFDEDSELRHEDLSRLFERLTRTAGDNIINEGDKNGIIDVIMKAMDVENNQTVGPSEFEHVIKNSEDFRSAFTFTL